MIFNIAIEIPETDLEDVTRVMATRYGYTATIQTTEEITVPAVIDTDGKLVEEERIVKTTKEVENPITLIEHMGNKISENMVREVKEDRKRTLINEATSAIDDSSLAPVMGVTIS